MNKLVQYLNQHLSGEVVTNPSVLMAYAKDESPLHYLPQMVVVPRTVSDIRKMLRFSWQLAEKGYSLSVIARGSGTNTTGAAIGNGVVVSFNPYMHKLFEYDMKQQLLRLQPGATIAAVQGALGLQGARLPIDVDTDMAATLGGCVANDSRALDWVRELEVVLANGDLLHTKKLSKREFNKKRGEQTFEGSIYRAIDTLLEEKSELVAKLTDHSVAGYNALARVRSKDGSFDLTPLFVGSQGTLGLISEMIVQTDFAVESRSVVVAAFADFDSLRDALDEVAKVTKDNENVTYYHPEIIKRVVAAGRQLPFGESDVSGGVLRIIVDDRSLKAQAKKVKRLVRVFEQHKAVVASSNDFELGKLSGLQAIVSLASQPVEKETHVINVASGSYIPLTRSEEFLKKLQLLGDKTRAKLLISGSPIDGIWSVSAPLDLGTVGGKQLVVKLGEEVATIVNSLDGSVAASSAEGRLMSGPVYRALDEDVAALYADLRAIFDPHGFLNRGIKQPVEISELAKHLRSN